MKLGLQVNRFSWPDAPASTGATWRAVARDADQCGLASLWVMDHFFQIDGVGPPDEPCSRATRRWPSPRPSPSASSWAPW